MTPVRCVLLAAIFFCSAVAALAQSVSFPGPGLGQFIIPIGTPTTIVDAAHGITSGVNVASVSFTTVANINAGQPVIACAALQTSGNSRTTSALSDGTNSYTLATHLAPTTSFDVAIYYNANPSAVLSGATGTQTFSGATGATNMHAAALLWQVSGVLTSSPLDAVNSGSATSAASVSVATGSLASTNEIAAGCAYVFSGTTTYSGASGFTNQVKAPDSAGFDAVTDWQKISAGVTYTPTWSGAMGNLIAATATFKGH